MDLCYGEHMKQKSFSSSNALLTYDGSHSHFKDEGECIIHKRAISWARRDAKTIEEMLEEHHKLIVDLQIGNDDVQNEHSKVVKDEGDLLVKKN